MATYPSAVLGQLDTSFWIDGVYNSLTLTDISTIDVTGTTKYLVRSNNDIAGSPIPTVKEWIEFYSFDEAGTDKDPILEITYTPTAGGNETVIPITGGYHTLEIVINNNGACDSVFFTELDDTKKIFARFRALYYTLENEGNDYSIALINSNGLGEFLGSATSTMIPCFFSALVNVLYYIK